MKELLWHIIFFEIFFFYIYFLYVLDVPEIFSYSYFRRFFDAEFLYMLICSSLFVSLLSLHYYCCFRWFIVCRVKNCFSSDKLNNRSASAAKSQDRLNPTQQSVTKSVSQPVCTSFLDNWRNQLGGSACHHPLCCCRFNLLASLSCWLAPTPLSLFAFPFCFVFWKSSVLLHLCARACACTCMRLWGLVLMCVCSALISSTPDLLLSPNP